MQICKINVYVDGSNCLTCYLNQCPGPPDDHITAQTILTPVIPSNSSTGDMGGGGNDSTSAPEDFHSGTNKHTIL